MARVRCLVLLTAAAVVSIAENAASAKAKVLDTVMRPKVLPLEETYGWRWKLVAEKTLQEKLQETTNKNKARNGILFIGDGMSVATIMAARTYGGQIENGYNGEENVLEFEKFPILGLARTYCIDAQVPDSACTATSYLTGVKTKYGVIGLDGNVTRGSCHSQLYQNNWANSIGQWALDQGLDVGLVTTTRVTHASPAGMYAHTSERNWESDADIPDECLALGCQDIAQQLVTGDTGRRFKVILGGGRKEFLPNNTNPLVNSTGRRLDGVDLIERWHQEKVQREVSHQFVSDKHELFKVFSSEDQPEYLLGLFHDDHMSYHLKSSASQPTLEEMTEAAIRILSRSSKGYFLFVEGGRIDHAHHDSLAHLALDETVEYSKAVKKARSLTNEQDTLIVVSSDHAHTMTVAGYPSRGNDILGLVDTSQGDDGIPYATISYANGKAPSIGADGKRIDVSLHQQFMSRDVDYSYPSLVPLDSETHGGEDVAVFASGPWQHLFTSSYEQNTIPHLMAYAMCLTDNKHDNCHRKGGFFSPNAGHRPLGPIVLILTVIFSLIVRQH